MCKLTKNEVIEFMNKEQLLNYWSNKLNNREYREEITEQEEIKLKENNLVLVHASSDDLVNLKGYISGQFTLSPLYFQDRKLIEYDERFIDFKSQLSFMLENKLVTNRICFIKRFEPSESEFFISFNTNFPHRKITIKDNGSLYCESILFSMLDL